MIIVTGGMGFIGSNIVQQLNNMGCTDILIVDSLGNGTKVKNLSSLNFIDYISKEDFRNLILHQKEIGKIDAVIHMGACSDTTESNIEYLMDNNYQYSVDLLTWCESRGVKFIYASSAAVYGLSNAFKEITSNESPINYYGRSKLEFDNFVRKNIHSFKIQVTGLRFFNVYGPGEDHKHRMASTIYHFNNQIMSKDKAFLFEGYDGYADGEQLRDFVYVKDCAQLATWFLKHSVTNIFNVGTGISRSFNDVAKNVIDFRKKGTIEYIPFPEDLKGSYQSFTKADISLLRDSGYKAEFFSLENGIKDYLSFMDTYLGKRTY